MRKSVSFLFIFVFIFIAFFFVAPYKITSSEGANLLYNGDFNLTTGDKKQFIGWGCTYFRVVEEKTGDYCVQSQTTGDGALLVVEQDGVNVEEAGKYNLKFKAKLAKADKSADVSVGFRVNGKDVVRQSKTITNTDFEEISFDFVLEEGVYKLNLQATNMSARVSIDDMVLSLVRENGVKTATGADLRMVKSSAGLRFKGSVDKNLYNGYVKDYGAENVQVGMIIAPTDFLADCEFTFDALSKSKAVQVCVATRWNNETTVATDGYYGFNCAFINILPYNTDREFSFRSFLRYTVGTQTEYIYSDYDKTHNSRSIYEIALALSEDKSKYENYQIEIIDYFCNLIDYPTQVVSKDGNTFSLTFSDIKGYFVLDYDRNAYSLTNASIVVGDDAAKSFSGMEYLPTAQNITITFIVDTAETLQTCPVRGKVYKIG